MAWAHRFKTPPPPHVCKPPMEREALPYCGILTSKLTGEAYGRVGDLWRCDGCRKLWRIGLLCKGCDQEGRATECPNGISGSWWYSATTWQRIRYIRRGR